MGFANLKSYFIVTVLLSGVPFLSFNIDSKEEKLEVNTLSSIKKLETEGDFGKIDDPLAFLDAYNKTTSNPNKKAKIIIGYVFKAKQSAEKLDKLNTESTSLFKKAIQISQRSNNRDFDIWTNLNYAYYLYRFRKYEESYAYFMYCINNLKDKNPENLLEPVDTYKKISYFLVTANENDLAITFLEKAERLAKEKTAEMAAIKDGIGLAYLNKNELKKAKIFFEEALFISRKVNDKTREAKALGNLAEIDFRNKDYTTAIEKLNVDIAISEKMHNNQNTMFALIKLCKFCLKIKSIPEAEKAIKSAQKIANSKYYYKNSLYEINGYLLQISQIEKNEVEELKIRREMDALSDSLKNLDGDEVVSSVGLLVAKKTLESNIELEKNKYEKQFYLKIISFLISGGLLIAIIVIVLLSRKRAKNRKVLYEKNLLNLKMEKMISENKLNSKAKSLLSYRNYLLEKIEQIQEVESELRKTQNLYKNKNDEYVSKLDELLKSHLLTTENWLNFKEAFEKEKPVYTKYLENNFPELTEASLRVIYLSQLELSNPEIGRVLGVTLSAVKKAKQRLRIKYKEDYDHLFEIQN